MKNDRLLKALRREPVDTTPIWVMRQAGRYLPEYRELRAEAGSFMALCSNPEWACEVTLQPLRRFDLDAAILFSDILTIPDAMGLGLYFAEGEGPRFENPVRSAADIEKLPVPDPSERLGYVTDAMSLIKKELDGKVPLIGFAGSPWTVATYMIEGGSSKEFARCKKLAFSEPALMHQLLDKITRTTAAYLQAQVEAGADVLMVFDTWGGMLNTHCYRGFSLAYMQRIVGAIDTDKTPVILFTKGGGAWLEAMADSGCQGLGLDWTLDIGAARERVGDRVCLQGNLDPGVLYGDEVFIREQVQSVISSFGNHPGHIFNLGHGIHQYVDPERMACLVDAVHEFGRDIRNI